ncbi:signal peptidase II [Clostridium amazonitimonense]|uniref:signal peptidase II n=1 Tax=Clostridium amazonitimonense TaxID=1499689 RepID=UPI000509E560|nr:signal peptidase II [Clostridium amazonitimonense]
MTRDNTRDIRVSLAILLLIILDQGIKLVVRSYYGVSIPIIEDIIYFKPFLNDKYSWMNSMFNFGLGKVFHVVLALVILILAHYWFTYMNNKHGYSKIGKILQIFLISGGLCSLIDKIFWNGSLDYIMLKGFFIFDLKDIYINVFNAILIIFVIKHRKRISKINEKEVLREYFKFIKKSLIIK